MQNCCADKSISANLEQILLKICLEHPMGRANCGKLKKSERERQAKQPTAFSELIRFWRTNRNRFSPTNGREISSSVYGQTRLGQLYKGENTTNIMWMKIYRILRKRVIMKQKFAIPAILPQI